MAEIHEPAASGIGSIAIIASDVIVVIGNTIIFLIVFINVDVDQEWRRRAAGVDCASLSFGLIAGEFTVSDKHAAVGVRRIVRGINRTTATIT
ncbi:hypothetical protein SRABI106_02896 [Rahnella aquatilis]|nr:hypothetical protein SRABI106_02896 [Rahnella aquatilis]